MNWVINAYLIGGNLLPSRYVQLVKFWYRLHSHLMMKMTVVSFLITQYLLPYKLNEFEETVLRPLDDIMEQSRNQIFGIDSDVANDKHDNCK